MLKPLRIAVIGAGTAGLACAICLAQREQSVVVFEKHAAVAPVGAGILMQPAGVRALDALGCGDAFRAVGSPIHRLQAHNHRDQRLADIPYDAPDYAYGVARGDLTELLQARARALGVRFELGTQVDRLVDMPGGPLVVLASNGTGAPSWSAAFDAVVLACGSNSLLAAAAGFGAAPEPYAWGALNGIVLVDDWLHPSELRQRVHGAGRMMGLLPSGRAGDKLKLSVYWSLPVSEYQAWRDRDWPDFVQEATTLWPAAAGVLAQLNREDLAFARYRHAMPGTYARGRVALAGDAAHAMSPQLGLGSTLALEDARVLARRLTLAPDVASGLAEYSAARRPAARNKQRISKLLTPLFQSHLPAWARDPLFIVGQHIPGMDRLMAYSLGS